MFAQEPMRYIAFWTSAIISASHESLLEVVSNKVSQDQVTPVPDACRCFSSGSLFHHTM